VLFTNKYKIWCCQIIAQYAFGAVKECYGLLGGAVTEFINL
jgi:hypothetical protein